MPPKVKYPEKPLFCEGSVFQMGPALRCLKLSLLQNDEKVKASLIYTRIGVELIHQNVMGNIWDHLNCFGMFLIQISV